MRLELKNTKIKLTIYRAGGGSMKLYKLKRVCAWCNKNMGTKPVINKPKKNEATHGICNKCLKKLDENLKKRRRKQSN